MFIMYLFLLIRKFFQNLLHFPLHLFYVLKDFFHYIRTGEYKKFQGFGIEIYCSANSAFGSGKTVSAVKETYEICEKYPEVSVLTNLTLSNFPAATKIEKLISYQQILDCADYTIILIDEIQGLLSNRDFMKGNSLDKEVFLNLCQVRHRHIKLIGTAQRFMQIDKQLREITSEVVTCKGYFAYPFTRTVNCSVYDGREYTLACESPLLPLYPLTMFMFVQTDFLRSLYDTNEVIHSIVHSPRNPYFDNTDLDTSSVVDKKSARKFKKSVGKLG